MSCRRLAATLAGAGFWAGAALAQIEAGGIGDVDPFGRGYLENDETAMPTDMWKASRTSELLPLMEKVRTVSLTPTERSLLRRVVLSPAARPDGDDAAQVLAQRARIMFEIGEAEAASDLLSRLEENPSGLDAEALAIDLQLALGNNATACEPRNASGQTSSDDAFWAKLRTVCALLVGDLVGADLAAEIAAGRGVDDDWFFNAVYATTTADEDGKPNAKYDSGLNLALSEAAELEPGDVLTATERGDLAAAMARRESLPIGLRVHAAGIAAEAGLIAADFHRDLFDMLLAQDGYEATRPIERALVPPAPDQATKGGETDGDKVEAPASETVTDTASRTDDLSEEAIAATVNVPAVRAGYLADALAAAAGDAARFAAMSRLLLEDIEALPRTASTSLNSLAFTRAAIAAGDPALAAAWLGAASAENAAEQDPFELAWTEGLVLLASGEVSKQDAMPVADAIADAADTTGKQRAAGQLFAAWTALDIASSASARAMLAGLDAPVREIGEWDLLRVGAAAEAGGAGEVVLGVIGFTGGDPARLAPLDLIVLIEALRDIDADDAARTLALEATGYWKPISNGNGN
ncbi:MAG: hypothetical protein AAFR00_06430 [Pseudomonadota bacterium]